MGAFIYLSRNGPRGLDISLVTFQVINNIVTSVEVVNPVRPGHD